MADDSAAPAAGGTSAPSAPSAPATPSTPSGPSAPPSPKGMSTDDAVAFLRERRKSPVSPAAEEGADSPDDRSPPYGADAGPDRDDRAPDDAGTADEPDEQAPIPPPRTWTKAEQEAFEALPREHQEILAARERERDAYYQRGLQDAAEQRRQAQAAYDAALQAQQHYEQALPNLLDQFAHDFRAEFQDIVTWDDVRTMRENDPGRFLAWQEAREKGQTLEREAKQAQQSQQAQTAQEWQNYVNWHDWAFLEKAPEFKDPKKAAVLNNEAKAMFLEAGFSEADLTGAWEYGQNIGLRDYRMQTLLRDALRYRQAEKARRAAQPKSVPPVQRPGVASSRGEVTSSHIRDLKNRLNATGKVDDAVALLRAQRNARSKAS